MKANSSTDHDEICSLAARMCDGSISDGDVERLEALLTKSSVNCDIYRSYLRLNAELMWLFRTGETAAQLTPSDEKLSSVEAVVRRRVSSRRRYAWGIFATIVAASLLLLIVWNLEWISPESPAGKIPVAQSQPSSRELDSSTQPFVATLLDATAAVWGGDSDPINVGERVSTGTLQLDFGQATVVFDSGAKLVVSGPSQLEIRTSKDIVLSSGTLVAQVPPTAIGFRVTTDAGVFTDLGTSFGLNAAAGGPSELEVFDGEVDSTSDQLASPLRALGGDLVKLKATGEAELNSGIGSSRFGQLHRQIVEPAQWKHREGGNGHFYQLVVPAQPLTWHEAALAATRRFHQGMAGHLVCITSKEENNFLIERFLSKDPLSGVWIGLTDVLRESSFQWVTGEPVRFTDWATHPEQQPDNFLEAEWHGGEDYGMFTSQPEGQPWAWNDLSVDSVHERVSAYLIEYEALDPSVNTRHLKADLILWPKDAGGNDHLYQLVLSLESTNWDTIRQYANESEVNGRRGHLLSLETNEERQFVVDELLRVCGIEENMLGLLGGSTSELQWVTGEPASRIETKPTRFPTEKVFGLMRWSHLDRTWEIQLRANEMTPAAWFGYVIEYPTAGDHSKEDHQTQ